MNLAVIMKGRKICLVQVLHYSYATIVGLELLIPSSGRRRLIELLIGSESEGGHFICKCDLKSETPSLSDAWERYGLVCCTNSNTMY